MKYKRNREGLIELLRREDVQELVREYGDALAEEAGRGFEANYVQGKSRYRGTVWAETWSARTRDRKNNILIRVLG